MLEEVKLKSLFENKTILITGGLGSIGSEIVEQLLNYNPKQIRIIDNRETELADMKEKYKEQENMRFFFGDIRDKERILRASEDVDIIFHAAAMKHVPICEYDPFEAIKTNIVGTQNIIDCCMKYNIERMILISTDKAVNPINVMGSTKLLAERLVSATCNFKGKNTTKYGVVRFGNVLSSRGSVLEIWEKQLKNKNKITITDPEATRFFMDIPQSVKLIFDASYYSNKGEVFILKMPSIKIGVLAEAFLEIKGYPTNYYKIIGTRNGDKPHEELIAEEETYFLKENKDLFVRLPLLITEIENNYKKFKKSEVKKYSSNDPDYLLNKEEAKKILLKSQNLSSSLIDQ